MKSNTRSNRSDGHIDTQELLQSERAYAALVHSIATCELPPGAFFNEREEAAKLGMSRTPFRQALHRLALEGLVETVPKRGVYVTRLDIHDIRDNMVVRQALETEMVRRLVLRGVTIDFEGLEQLYSKMERAAKRGDAFRFLRTDEEFHLRIVGAAGNERAMEAVQRTWIHVNRARYLEKVSRPDIGEALAEHRDILDSLRRGDVADAVRAVRAHLEQSLDRLDDITRRVPSAFLTPVTDVDAAGDRKSAR